LGQASHLLLPTLGFLLSVEMLTPRLQWVPNESVSPFISQLGTFREHLLCASAVQEARR
jgi:hypothetical protein